MEIRIDVFTVFIRNLLIKFKIIKNVKNALSRNEIKNIFAGQVTGGGEFDVAVCGGSFYVTLSGVVKSGNCRATVYLNLCLCSSELGKCKS